MSRVGISVQREYAVECTSCGTVDGRPTRAKADEAAREHAKEHRAQGQQTRQFGSYSDAYEYANTEEFRP